MMCSVLLCWAMINRCDIRLMDKRILGLMDIDVFGLINVKVRLDDRLIGGVGWFVLRLADVDVVGWYNFKLIW